MIQSFRLAFGVLDSRLVHQYQGAIIINVGFLSLATMDIQLTLSLTLLPVSNSGRNRCHA